MQVAKVILDIQSNQFADSLEFAILPGKSAHVEFESEENFDPEIGSVVVVPFGKQFKLGFIVDIVSESDISRPANTLKAIACVASKSFFTKENIEFAKFISKKYLSSMATSLRLFVPSGSMPKLKHVNSKWIVTAHKYRITDKNYTKKYISENLQEKNNWESFVLTEGQASALKKISSAIDNNQNDVFVLDGVTGSGKTEVYLRAISKVLNKGKTAIVLVPEISLTPQTVSRFSARFGDSIAVLHSKMTPAERHNQFVRIKNGEIRIVIGARSALFCPIQNIGLIVIDEEHENSYKQDNNPRYHSRSCAEWLAKQQAATLILGSATPSMEALHKCETESNWHLLELPERTNGKPLPQIEIVDMGIEFKSGRKNLFSYNLTKSILKELKAGNKVLLFHNRRGFSNYMFCRSCGYTPTCTNCSTTMTYHQKFEGGSASQFLKCHHCGHTETVPVKCPECESPYIAKYGAGTQNVEDSLKALLAKNGLENVPVIRMDTDTTKNVGGHQKCLDEFSKTGPSVLLGTQMIAKGLDFDDVTLVGIVLIDTNLSLPDFRASERTFNMILQVAGRAGRGKKAGKVIVQTYTPDSEAIELASTYDKKTFLTIEAQKRVLLHFPPYYQLANIVSSSTDEDIASQHSQKIQELLEKNLPSDVNIMPSTSCVIEKLRKQYRYHIVLKASLGFNLSEFVERALNPIKKTTKVKVTIDIDPINLL